MTSVEETKPVAAAEPEVVDETTPVEDVKEPESVPPPVEEKSVEPEVATETPPEATIADPVTEPTEDAVAPEPTSEEKVDSPTDDELVAATATLASLVAE